MTSTRRAAAVARVGIGVVAVGAAAISFDHIHHLARIAGESAHGALLYPLTLDGAVAAGAAVVLSGHPFPRSARLAARWLLLIGLLTSSAANFLAGPSIEAKVGGALLPLLVMIGAEVISAPAAEPAPAVKRPKVKPAVEQQAETVVEKPKPDKPAAKVKSAGDRDLLAEARAANAAHEAEHGAPISRNKLRMQLGIGQGPATKLIKQLEEVAS
ncbi:MAG TPA: DUF2637 domain-containing protein [Kribbella sp.]